jgi:hypothetical protein
MLLEFPQDDFCLADGFTYNFLKMHSNQFYRKDKVYNMFGHFFIFVKVIRERVSDTGSDLILLRQVFRK